MAGERHPPLSRTRFTHARVLTSRPLCACQVPWYMRFSPGLHGLGQSRLVPSSGRSKALVISFPTTYPAAFQS